MESKESKDLKPWYQLSESALFEKRISELNLGIKDTALEKLIQKFYKELLAKNLSFYPPCFIADEWFCPYGVSAIGIPFYLTHRKLRKIERKHVLDAEGETIQEFMQLIRHEAGHAYSYAYNLYKKAKWRKLFGSAAEEYPDTYRPKPYSKSHVRHLENWYAQSHPDEDFAETFAVWLTPHINWKKEYRGWKAIEKLEYVDELMKQLAGKTPAVKPPVNFKKLAGLNLKFKTYYSRKKKEYAEDFPNFYDDDLNYLFTRAPEERGELKAARYLKSSHQKIVDSVSYWTKERKYTVDQLLKNLTQRCRQLNLYTRKEDKELDLKVSSFITTLVSNYLFTGKFKRKK